MDLVDAYLEIAGRSIDAADATLAANLSEPTMFYSYHAFESVGGAICTSVGLSYPKAHDKKLNSFITASKRHFVPQGTTRIVASIAIEVASMRNLCLYPKQITANTYETPQKTFSLADARKLLKWVRGVVRDINKTI